MQKRYMCIWFPYLTTDWLIIRKPELRDKPFVFTAAERGRKIIKTISPAAQLQQIEVNTALANAKAIVPDLEVFDYKSGREVRLLKAIGEWCIRYSPIVAVDNLDGLILDTSGCTHLWGGETAYLQEIINRLRHKGYHVHAAIADTIGTAWAVCRFGKPAAPIVPINESLPALIPLPAEGLRLEPTVVERLKKLGLSKIKNFITMPRSVLRRRFGEGLLLRLAQALGQEEEVIIPIQLVAPYQERLPCLEPIRTATGIEIAIKNLLQSLCTRLQGESKGLRTATLKCFRVDGKIVQTAIGTNSPSHHIHHLFKLFELNIPKLAPGLGIELFVMEAAKIEEISPLQEVIWASNPGLDDQQVAELLDRLSVKIGTGSIHRYLPDEHYWPERTIRIAGSISEHPVNSWRTDKQRPTKLLKNPEPIEVTAPIPDYPPMLFRYKGKIHLIKKADGPERIEREWWLDAGEHRDYYHVEDDQGQRYWLFRSGHYAGDKSNHWFIHGYFA